MAIVTIQPNPIEGKDAPIMSQFMANFNWGNHAWLIYGYFPEQIFQCRSLIQFNIAAYIPPVVPIISATLWFHMGPYSVTVGERTINMHKTLASWNEMTVTWNNKPAFDPAVASTRQVNEETNIWRDWILPVGLIQNWRDNPATNYGLLIKDLIETEPNQCRGSHSSDSGDSLLRPKLIIEYGGGDILYRTLTGVGL